MLFILISFSTLLFLVPSKTTQNNNGVCSLTGQTSSDPFPSLTKCYRFNNNACCTSVHDDYINTSIGNILTTPCMRKYTELEELMCLGCHPYESQYIDRTTSTLYICNSFAYKLWNASSVEELNQPTRKFDNCGFKISDYLAANSSISKRGQLKDISPNGQYIIPSESFKSFKIMIDAIKVPFYEDFHVELVDNSKEDYRTCFNGSGIISISALFLTTFSLLIL